MATPGTIVTFYSYKGGVGRTMALANVSWILASAGKSVLAVDWDLESPGLHKYFHPFLDHEIVAATPGIVELLTNYCWEATEPHIGVADWQREYARILPYAVSLDWSFPEGGTLDFVSAGRQNRDYTALVTSFDMDNFYSRLGGGQFFDALRVDMKENYDYVMIDSRTGLSDIADVCAVHFPDVLVDCFTLSGQSIEGAAAVARHIDERYRDRGIRILPVPMRIEFGENAKVEVGRALARTRFDGFPKGLSPDEMNRYWLSVEIPYRPFYAFEETLATFGDAPGSPNSMLAAFERLTGAITEGQVGACAPMDEQIRLATLGRYARRGPVDGPETLIVYASEDRPWADWISMILGREGFRVSTHCADVAPLEELDGRRQANDQALVLVSPAFIASRHGRRAWEALAAEQPAGARPRVTALRILNAQPTPVFAQIAPVDLTALDEDQAADAILRALGRPGLTTAAAAGDRGRPAVPFPGAARTAPAVWNVDRRNAVFTGRGAVLEKLRGQLLGATRHVVLPQALHGLGGVGKTQVALEYAHRFRADYDVVWWVPALRPDSIRSALAALAARLGLRVGEDIAEAANTALEALRCGTPYARWLLIFDGTDNPAELEQFLPGGDGHVLITSRDPAWTQFARPIPVDVFTEEEATLHLLRRVPGIAADHAVRIGRALGFLPLAIEQVAAWLAATSMPAGEYLDALRRETASTLTLSTEEFPQSVTLTWKVSFRRLREASPAAARLLELLAFFSSDPISLDLIYSDATARILARYDETLRDTLVLGRVIREISRFGLATVDQGNNSIRVHRLVQAVMRDGMEAAYQSGTRHDVHMILAAARPPHGDTDDPENWPAFETIMPHVTASLAAESDDEDTRQLLIELVRYRWKRGDHEGALEGGRYLADLWRERLGPDHWQRLFLLSQLANVHRAQGGYAEAYELDRDVWTRQRGSATIGPTHPHTLMTASGLAADMRALGMFKDALALDLQTRAAFQDLYGEDDDRTLMATANLAVSYRALGMVGQALEADEDTRERRRATLGDKHPYTLFSAANLARDMREAGRYEESVALLRVTYETYLDVLGDQLPDPLRTATSLAVSLRRAGRADEALTLARVTCERYRRCYPNSPDAVAADAEAAACLWAVGDGTAARDRIVRALGVVRAVLGAEHHYAHVLQNNRAVFLREVGDAEKAREIAAVTLEKLRTTFGMSHPFASIGGLNLAACLADLGHAEEAAALETGVVAELTERLGGAHPDTLAARWNHVLSLQAIGRAADAAARRTELLGLMCRTLGEGHPDVVTARRGRRLVRDLEPQPA